MNKFLQDFFVKIALRKYADKETIKKMLSGTFENNKSEEKDYGYIICEIIQNDIFENTVTELFKYSKNTKFGSDIFGTFMIFLLYKENFNTIDNLKKSINRFIKNIPENILKNIRCVYGIENAKIESFRTSNGLRYIILLKDFYKKIFEIGKIKYGEKIEIKNNF
jgi:hypothetical protein